MMATKVKYVQVKASITQEQHRLLERWAKVLGESPSEYVRNAIIARHLQMRKTRG